jgi:hypothetical protein
MSSMNSPGTNCLGPNGVETNYPGANFQSADKLSRRNSPRMNRDNSGLETN